MDELDIKPCTGCCACAVGFVFGNGRGDCVLKDDFHILEEAMYEADAVIIGSPTLVLSPSGTFKTVADRLGPSHDYSAKEWYVIKLVKKQVSLKRSFRMCAALNQE